MKETGILMSGPLIGPTMEGLKTQTRRLQGLKEINADPNRYSGAHLWQPDDVWWDFHIEGTDAITRVKCPYGKIGDRLYVRETWRPDYTEDDILYRSDGEVRRFLDQSEWFEGDYLSHAGKDTLRWRPSIHQPRWASRITLEITDVRVERLQDISEEDAKAEGITDGGCTRCGEPERSHPYAQYGCFVPLPDYRDSFIWLWNQINGKTHPWESNPWVWCLSFQRVK